MVPALSITGIRVEFEGYIVTPGGVEVCEPEEAEGDDRTDGGEPGGALLQWHQKPRAGSSLFG
jgi:hypothetical protein